MPSKAKKIFSILGILGPLALFIASTVLSVSWSGYNFLTQYLSILGSETSPFANYVNIFGFGLFGIIMLGFAMTLGAELKNNRYADIATRLFLGGGVLIFLLGFFPTDPNFTNLTLHGRPHTLIGAIAFIMIPISMIWYGLAFKQDENWDGSWMTISFVLAMTSLAVVAILGFFPNYIYGGTVERIGIGANLLWIFFVSINMLLNQQVKEVFDSGKPRL